jgi:HlyD family secretion protein
MSKGLLIVGSLVVLGGAAWWFFGRGDAAAGGAARFRTAKVERGEIVEGVQASGTVQPVVLVQVGTQVSGVIEKLFADFNSKVTAGQTIAKLDTRKLDAQIAQDEATVARSKADLERMKSVVAQSRTDVERARANVGQSLADVARVKALLTQAEQELGRQRELAQKKLVAQSDLEAAVASKGSLDAQLASAEASVKQAQVQISAAEDVVRTNEAQLVVGEAAIRQSEAALKGDKVNLDYATIVSPVDGVVVSRNVDVGQTVAASLSAPTLFVIANDLTKIQVQTSVPEADVGRIQEGQKAHFTVDAHPERTFEGAVSQVRLASTTVQNVVTYTVLVDASNPRGLLLPGMTANVTFEIQRSAKDTLTVPASALRLQAPPELVDNPEALTAKPAETPPAEKPAAAEKPAEARAGADGAPSPDGKSPADGAPAAGGERRGRGERGSGGAGGRGGRRRSGFVYVQTPAGKLHAVAVKLGISDGVRTVVEPTDAAALPEGADVVTAVLREEEPATTNPFAPPRMGGGGGGRGGGGGGR